MSATTGAPPEDEVEPLQMGPLGKTECKRRKKSLFALQTFTELLAFCTTYMVLEIMEVRQFAKNTPQYDSSELVGITFALFIINILFAVYCYVDDGGIKRRNDLTCFNQVAGMKTIFTVNMVIAIASVFAFRYPMENKMMKYGVGFGSALIFGLAAFGHYSIASK